MPSIAKEWGGGGSGSRELLRKREDSPSGTSSTFLATGRATMTGFWRCSVPFNVCFLFKRAMVSLSSHPHHHRRSKRRNSQGRQILLREAISLVSPIVQSQTVQVVALDTPQPTLTVLCRSEAGSEHLSRRRGRRESIESGDGSRGVLSTEVGDVDPDVGRRRTGGGGRRC